MKRVTATCVAAAVDHAGYEIAGRALGRRMAQHVKGTTNWR
jgi:hypothetical protein